jgi:hypothetical protein
MPEQGTLEQIPVAGGNGRHVIDQRRQWSIAFRLDAGDTNRTFADANGLFTTQGVTAVRVQRPE